MIPSQSCCKSTNSDSLHGIHRISKTEKIEVTGQNLICVNSYPVEGGYAENKKWKNERWRDRATATENDTNKD